MDVLFLIT